MRSAKCVAFTLAALLCFVQASSLSGETPARDADAGKQLAFWRVPESDDDVAYLSNEKVVLIKGRMVECVSTKSNAQLWRVDLPTDGESYLKLCSPESKSVCLVAPAKIENGAKGMSFSFIDIEAGRLSTQHVSCSYDEFLGPWILSEWGGYFCVGMGPLRFAVDTIRGIGKYIENPKRALACFINERALWFAYEDRMESVFDVEHWKECLPKVVSFSEENRSLLRTTRHLTEWCGVSYGNVFVLRVDSWDDKGSNDSKVTKLVWFSVVGEVMFSKVEKSCIGGWPIPFGEEWLFGLYASGEKDELFMVSYSKDALRRGPLAQGGSSCRLYALSGNYVLWSAINELYLLDGSTLELTRAYVHEYEESLWSFIRPFGVDSILGKYIVAPVEKLNWCKKWEGCKQLAVFE